MRIRLLNRFGMTLLAAAAVFVACAPPAGASVIASVQSVTANAGSTGNVFDVLLTDSGPSAVTIAAFNFGLLIADTDISVTDANTSTSQPYIFAGNSLFGPDLTGPVSGQSLIVSDIYAIPAAGITLSAGGVVGLAHILFDVAPHAAAGMFAVTLDPSTTSLSDPNGNLVPINTLSGGTITVTSSGPTVPEPGTGAMGLVALVGLGLWRWRKSFSPIMKSHRVIVRSRSGCA